MQVDQLGLIGTLELAALHVHVARLDIRHVDQPAALRPAVKDHQNDGDHHPYDGERRLADSVLGFGAYVARHNVNCVTCCLKSSRSVHRTDSEPHYTAHTFPQISREMTGKTAWPTLAS